MRVGDTPELREMLVLSWQPGSLDRWLEKHEQVAGHPRDPHQRVEAIASSRHVIVEIDGLRLADNTRPVLLFETDLPTRYYLPARTSTTAPSSRPISAPPSWLHRRHDHQGSSPRQHADN